jgi:hypothetical protein
MTRRNHRYLLAVFTLVGIHCPEVGFEDIAIDLPQARLWTVIVGALRYGRDFCPQNPAPGTMRGTIRSFTSLVGGSPTIGEEIQGCQHGESISTCRLILL